VASISIIIPVHNTEEYLEECLHSLSQQTHSDCEFICVDDGSSDGSAEILAKYAANDKRFRLLRNEEPRGPGACRNLGIAQAQGEWIGFVDSDDLIAPSMYERLLHEAVATDSDIAICSTRKFSEAEDQHFVADTNHKYLGRFYGHTFTWMDLGDDILRLRFVCWNRLYRRSLLDEGIRFPEGIFYEDMPFHLEIMMRSARMIFVPEDFYFNRRGRAGATTFDQSDRLLDLHEALRISEQILLRSPKAVGVLSYFYYFAFRKSYEHLHKNVRDFLYPYYKKFQGWAEHKELDDNPHMTPPDLAIREDVLTMSCDEFMVRDYWRARVNVAELKREIRHYKSGSYRKSPRKKSSPSMKEVAPVDTRSLPVRALAKAYRGVFPLVFRRAVRGLISTQSSSTASSAAAGNKKRKAKVKASPKTGQASWDIPESYLLGYPRLHPENAYDAMDFLRSERVLDHNRRLVETIRKSVAETGRKIRVGFVVNQKEKWNGSQLVEALDESGVFEWSFVLCLSAEASRLSRVDRSEKYREELEYFSQKGRVEFELYDALVDESMPIESIDYDIVFLQQPWGMKDFPRRLVGKVLCAYMHYGFMVMANHGMHYHIAPFHSYLFKYFTQTEMHRQMHIRHDPSAYEKLVVSGYPKLDVYLDPAPERDAVRAWRNYAEATRTRVIFAPHHSLGRDNLGMATFRWSGQAMISLRREAKNVDWIYKPHPTLGFSVVRNKVMAGEQYEAYVREWENGENSTVYDAGDYFDIFRSSDALVTDCGSFLAEYLPTGKPIIWLISDRTVGLNAVGKALAEGFYQVRTVEELEQVFNQVVVGGDDPLKDIRENNIERILGGRQNSSESVVEHLRSVFL